MTANQVSRSKSVRGHTSCDLQKKCSRLPPVREIPFAQDGRSSLCVLKHRLQASLQGRSL